jgi:probable addiction module antidote protein
METTLWDPADHLGSEEAIAEYITATLEDGDAKLLAAALGDVARARGMTEIAREALCGSLGTEENLSFDTVLRVAKELGIKLVAQTDEAA